MLNNDRAVVYVDKSLPEPLVNWARDAGIELIYCANQSLYELRYESQRLQMHWLAKERFSPVFVEMPDQRRLSSSNLLLKALGKNTKVVADLTAGLGVDALTMAASGRRVYCVERCAPAAMLLRDGLNRCPQTIADKIKIHFCDSRDWLKSSRPKLDAIYIDTMFADKKQKVKPSKQMHILRTLAGDDPDAAELIDCALAQDVNRVVVKHANRKARLKRQTMAQFEGKLVRFDIYKANHPS